MAKLPTFLLAAVLAPGLHAEVHSLTLSQAVELALKQNIDVLLARLDEQEARHGVRVAKDPFATHIVAGSGLAYSSGFPMSIEGAAPAVVQARAIQALFNRSQSFRVAQARKKRGEPALRSPLVRKMRLGGLLICIWMPPAPPS